MDSKILMIGTGLVAGLLHAFDPDHIAAITAFVGPAPSIRKAVAYAARWAAGHGMMLLFVGLIAMNISGTSHALEGWTERVVGVTLILIGLWSIRRVFKLHQHEHQHADGVVHVHSHSHLKGPTHLHTHAPTAMGVLHGLAGTGGVLVAVPAGLAGSQALAFLFLATFGAGVAFAMLAYAGTIALMIRRRSAPSTGFQMSLSGVAGLFNLAVGTLWIVG